MPRRGGVTAGGNDPVSGCICRALHWVLEGAELAMDSALTHPRSIALKSQV